MYFNNVYVFRTSIFGDDKNYDKNAWRKFFFPTNYNEVVDIRSAKLGKKTRINQNFTPRCIRRQRDMRVFLLFLFFRTDDIQTIFILK